MRKTRMAVATLEKRSPRILVALAVLATMIFACAVAANAQSSSEERSAQRRLQEDIRIDVARITAEAMRYAQMETRAALAQASVSLRQGRSRFDRIDMRLDTTFVVERGTILDLNVLAGVINVEGWDRNEMEFRGHSTTGSLGVSYMARSARLETRGSRGINEVSLTVRVPRGTRVAVNSSRGDVHVVDVRGEVDATVTNGEVTVRGATGRTAVSSMTGDIVLQDIDGPVRVKGLTGGIKIVNVRGDVDVSASTSDVSLRDVRAVIVQVQLVRGDIEFGGTLVSDGRYEFNTHSGDVRLHLNDDAKGMIDVQSFKGELHSTFPLVLLPGQDVIESPATKRVTILHGKSYTTTTTKTTTVQSTSLRNLQHLQFGSDAGDGARISVSTFNGDVHIDRVSATTARPARKN
ncbi:MAG: DUF4097 family beta strand repeat-containing protein [Gemmatimonadaceae bacterium]